jgi:hypothetical protein
MENIHSLRRKEKEITDPAAMKAVLKKTRFVTVAMCRNDEPYLVTLSHGYDEAQHAVYFHCAQAGKKIDILRTNNRVWGQAFIDRGYLDGRCDHQFESVQFAGRVTFVETVEGKRRALDVMIRQLESAPEKVAAEQVSAESLRKVCIGRIDIDFLSGKKSVKAAGPA